MKPKEFDELIRQKFDQNEFAYSPRNWDRLADELEGRAKKRSMIMWLWMPAAGMAASVALAIGVSALLRFGAPADESGSYTHTSKFATARQQAIAAAIPAEAATPVAVASLSAVRVKHVYAAKAAVQPADNNIGISFNNVDKYVPAAVKAAEKSDISLAAVQAVPKVQKAPPVAKKEKAPVKPGYNTFKEEEKIASIKKPVKFSIILSGGINQGSHNSGYAAGATVRRMVNEHVYVEGDIAFASSDNTQPIQYLSGGSGTGSASGSAVAKPAGAAGKMAKVESDKTAAAIKDEGVLKTHDVSYNLYYAQVTPSIGYKLMKRLSVGVGPDFQKVLVDNRPEQSSAYRGNIQVAPLFDVGFVGKSEFAVTNGVKAAVAYRKGINGIITPSDRYIDRDYVQFQVKCTIFNK